MRGSTILMGALVALLLCAVPGSTQNLAPWRVQGIEREFAYIETQRMEGNCAERDRVLAQLRRSLAAIIDPAGTIRPDIKEEYRTRLTEAAARRCPAAAPPAPPVARAPLPRTMTLDSVRAEFAGTCGAAFHPARERLVAALDRSVRIERDAGRRAALESDRARVIALPYRSCGVQPPPPPPLSAEITSKEAETLGRQMSKACGDNWSVLRLRMLAALDRAIAAETELSSRQEYSQLRSAYLRADPPPCDKAEAAKVERDKDTAAYNSMWGAIERELLAASQARTAGDCTARIRHIALARTALRAREREDFNTPDRRHRDALAAEMALSCTPKRAPATTAAPVPPGGLRMCNAIYHEEKKLGRPITCRCNRVEQYLSVWGSNPYSAASTICNAAVHAGVLPPNGVGIVRTVPVPHSEQALGSLRNGISSSNWDHDRENGFTFSAGGSVSP